MLRIFDHDLALGPLPRPVRDGAFIAGIGVQGGEDIEHAFVRKASLRIERSDVLAVDLADEGQRIVIRFPVFLHRERRILHVHGEIRVAPPLGGAEEFGLDPFEVDLDGHQRISLRGIAWKVIWAWELS